MDNKNIPLRIMPQKKCKEKLIGFMLYLAFKSIIFCVTGTVLLSCIKQVNPVFKCGRLGFELFYD